MNKLKQIGKIQTGRTGFHSLILVDPVNPVHSSLFRLRAPGIFFSAFCLCALLLPEAVASVNGFHQSKNEIDRFVEMPIVAETDGERAALLDGNSRLVTVELGKRLILSQAGYKQALEIYRKQLALFEETKDEAGIAGAYEDRASAHYEQEEYAVDDRVS
jgi:hypothetical protein